MGRFYLCQACLYLYAVSREFALHFVLIAMSSDNWKRWFV